MRGAGGSRGEAVRSTHPQIPECLLAGGRPASEEYDDSYCHFAIDTIYVTDVDEKFSTSTVSSIGRATMTRSQLLERAREFRQNPTRSERILWNAIRGRSLGVCFYRQQVMWPFIADFTVERPRLVVEIDGRIHEGQLIRDAERQQRLEAQGYSVVRFSADDVEYRLDAVLAFLTQVLSELRAGRPAAARPLW
jgi:very-short-patch-repair endonuclease